MEGGGGDSPPFFVLIRELHEQIDNIDPRMLFCF